MKVLFLTNLPAPYRVKFFEELGKLCDLTVIYERKSASDRDTKWISDHEATYHEIFLGGKEIGTDNSFSFNVIRYVKDRSYNKIIIGMYSTYTAMVAILYMKCHNIPFWISTDGGFIKEESPLKYKLKRFLIGAAHAWLTTGKGATDYLVHYGAIREKCYTYPFASMSKSEIMGKPLTLSQKKMYRKKLGIVEEKIILSIGQFIYRKGYDLLLEACKNIDPQIGIYIIGGVPTKDYLELKDKYKLNNVHFLDFMVKDELENYYKAADIFVHPTREDVWGLVVNEAMGYGLPVITTKNCMAGNELIEKGVNGDIIDPDNFKQLEYAIKKMIDDKLEKYSENSIKKIENYTYENMARVHYQILINE